MFGHHVRQRCLSNWLIRKMLFILYGQIMKDTLRALRAAGGPHGAPGIYLNYCIVA